MAAHGLGAPPLTGLAITSPGARRTRSREQMMTQRQTRTSLKLYFHPLSSFCQKVLVAFYENETPFEPHIVDLADEASSADFKKVWPIGKFPVLRDDARDRTVPESSIIIEYLSQHYPGETQLVPADADLARQTRLRDRFFDMYVNDSLGKIVG